MNREIVDVAFLQQFKKYMFEKKANESKETEPDIESGKCWIFSSLNCLTILKENLLSPAGKQHRRKRETITAGYDVLKTLTNDEIKEERSNFLKDKFPGMDPKGLPTKLVEYMSAPSPNTVLESQALVYNPVDEKQTCAY